MFLLLGTDGGPQRRDPQPCYGPDIYHLLRTRIGGTDKNLSSLTLALILYFECFQSSFGCPSLCRYF